MDMHVSQLTENIDFRRLYFLMQCLLIASYCFYGCLLLMH